MIKKFNFLKVGWLACTHALINPSCLLWRIHIGCAAEVCSLSVEVPGSHQPDQQVLYHLLWRKVRCSGHQIAPTTLQSHSIVLCETCLWTCQWTICNTCICRWKIALVFEKCLYLCHTLFLSPWSYFMKDSNF